MGDLISLQSGQDFAPAEYNDQEIGVPYMTGASCNEKGETVVGRRHPGVMRIRVTPYLSVKALVQEQL